MAVRVFVAVVLVAGVLGPRAGRMDRAQAGDPPVEEAPIEGPAVDGPAVEGPVPAAPVVARVAGQAVTTAELAAYWFARYPEEYVRTLDALVDARLARAEAARAALGVPRDALARAVEREVAAREEQVRALYGETGDLSGRVAEAYGMDVATWRERILRPRLYDRLLLERVVRWDTRRRLRLAVRVLVRPDERSAQALREQVERGADFSLLAASRSIDPTARAGGDLPSIGEGDLAFPGVEERLFAARPGALVGPLRVEVEGVPQWHLYKVVERQPAWPATPEARSTRLERDLVEHPVQPAEYERWRARAVRAGTLERYRPDGRPWR